MSTASYLCAIGYDDVVEAERATLVQSTFAGGSEDTR